MLEKINSPKDLKKLNINELNELANEIREVLLNKILKVGGHLGPNLGVIELTIALHYVFNSPTDKIVFAHKKVNMIYLKLDILQLQLV